MRAQSTCLICGSQFQPSHKSTGLYCSPACGYKGRAPRPRTSAADRLWKRVQKTEGCWTWTGATDGWGYGEIFAGSTTGASHLKAHRVSYELHFGPIPDGLLVLHRCDNPPCVRPDHLFLGTNQDNSTDCVSKQRHAHGELVVISKLTETDVREIRALHDGGHLSMPAIAKRYGVSDTQVWQIVKRRQWRHIV